MNLLCKDALSFGERVWGSPPQALVFHRAHFGNRFPAGQLQQLVLWTADHDGREEMWLGSAPLYEGASTASLSARATSCPFTLSVFLGEGPEQARGVRDRRCEVGIRGAGHSPHSCNSAGVGEEGSPFVPGRHWGDHCGPAVPPHLTVLPTLAWPPWLPRHRVCGLCPGVRDRKGSLCVLGMATRLQQDCGPMC